MHQSPSPFRSLTLKQRARFMRHHPTLSEQMLWHMLRSQRLGVRFVRQVPLLGRYIVDFLAPVVKLVVEVDGEVTLSGQLSTLGGIGL